MKISEVAEISGLSKRTLQYYDEIGLLNIRKNKENNYRIYDKSDLKLIQEIILLKDIGVPLFEIKKIVHDKSFDRIKFLNNHMKLLEKKVSQYKDIIKTINKSIKQEEGQLSMKNQDYFDGFSDEEVNEHYQKYKEESHNLYGNTDEYKSSMMKTKKYSKEKWDTIKKEADEIYKKFALAMNGQLSGNIDVLVRKWQEHITMYYYTCTDEILLGLADLYISDERFVKNIDKYGDGLAKFISESIKKSIKN